VLRFNPWHFTTHEALLRGFFKSLAQAADASLSTRGEQIGELLARYGGILSLANITLGGVVELSAGEAAKQLGEGLSTVELETLRDRLEKALVESGIRIIVMIDDIDRLDRDEIHAVFKLVKLSAGFANISYILAFDPIIVAESLGARYGAGDSEAGRQFLGKIVQVPLDLPPADSNELRTLTFEGVDRILNAEQINLSAEQAQAFGRHFIDGIEPCLRTPRQAKLFLNAITFALPMLKGEVNPVDQMLIEGVRIFYPKLYDVIRDHPERFLTQPRGGMADPRRAVVDGLIEAALSDLGETQREQVLSRLITPLFPRYGTMGYGGDWERSWAKGKKVCSAEYFPRYFGYGLPKGDVPDQAIAGFIAAVSGGLDEMVDDALETWAVQRAIPKLIGKLRDYEESLPADAARRLALALARNGQKVPREQQQFIADTTMMQAAILVAHLLKRIPKGAKRNAVAREVAASAKPLRFAAEILRWIRHDPRKPIADRIVAPAVERELGRTVATRTQDACGDQPVYRLFGGDTPFMLFGWRRYGDRSKLRAHLEGHIVGNPEEALAYIKTYLGRAWGMDSGLSVPSDFDISGYESIKRAMNPAVVFDALRKRYGSVLDKPVFRHREDTPRDEALAHQYAVIHLRALGGSGSDDGVARLMIEAEDDD
jgi:predicted KAP-like P-loop ATPase